MNTKQYKERFISYIRETILNKIFAVMLIALGWLTVGVTNDITFFVLTLIIGVPLFFMNRNYIG